MATYEPPRQLNTDLTPEECRDRLYAVLDDPRDADDVIGENPSFVTLSLLSSHRRNVLEWYPFRSETSILELHGNYGEVTGALLGDGKHVTTLTENEAQAAVIRRRFDQPENLCVVTTDIMSYLRETDKRFDYIVFVGGCLTPEQLVLVREHLCNDGKLLIACENRNGMMFLAGCRDPYTKRYYDSVDGYRGLPEYTYDLPRWKSVLTEAGFEQYTFRYPYPDYRFCEVIYSDEFLPKKHQLCKNLRNFDGKRLLTFDEGAVFNTAIGYGVFPLFSNSFFIETGPSCGVVYTKFSKERRFDYRVHTSLLQEEQERRVIKTAADARAAHHVCRMMDYKEVLSRYFEDERFHVADCDVKGNAVCFEYIKGKTLSAIIDDAVTNNDDTTLYEALDILKEAISRVTAEEIFEADEAFRSVFGEVSFSLPMKATSYAVVDLIADNLIVNDKINLIDYEWILPFAIPAPFIMFRALMLNNGISVLSEDKHAAVMAYVGLDPSHINTFWRMEEAFQRYVSSARYDMQKLYARAGQPTYDLRRVDLDHLLYRTIVTDADDGRLLGTCTQNSAYATIHVLLDEQTKMLRVEFAQTPVFMHRPSVTAVKNGETVTVDGLWFDKPVVDGENLYFETVPYMDIVNKGYSSLSISYVVYAWNDLASWLIDRHQLQRRITQLEEENQMLKADLQSFGAVTPVADDRPMDVSIVIPTKNGGEVFKKVLEAVYAQKTNYRYEVICVDSGSSDDTLETIRHFGATLYEIPPSEFGHGKTRNYGASKGTGEFIVFITQDAQPASESWLQNFIDAMKADDEIVGGFGIHYAYPDCNIFDKRDLVIHFQGFGTDNTVYSLEDPERYEREEGYRHMLAFFSDNNSCLRRSVWERYPYEDVNFAEDQKWARQMIELGFKKLYCPHAPVYHSHDYPLHTYFKRYYDEFKSLYTLHGFLIVPAWYYTIPAAIKHLISDVKYLRTQPIGRKAKIKWAWYSLWRNTFKYVGGFIGGKYHTYSPKLQRFLDRHISQQYDQIHDKNK